MKKLLLLTILLMVTVAMMSPTTKAQETGPLAFVGMASGFIDNSYENASYGGGLKMGFMTTIDESRGLYLRTVYNQFSVGVDSIQMSKAVDITGLLVWDFGKKWDFYFMGGATAMMSGPTTGTDIFGGIGMSKVMWTQKIQDDIIYPAQFKLFLEVNLSDGDDATTGNYAQLNLGFTLSPPVRKKQ